MTRINAIRNAKQNSFVAWGKQSWDKKTGALVFAAVLIICSVTVGCSSSNNNDKPKPESTNIQIPVSPTPVASMPVPVMQAETKPAPKKVVHKKPATVNYTDKSTGLTFEYPRRYAIETGSAATDLLVSSAIPMNFVQPGGVALAAVELPETGFANTDFSSAFFNVSVHKTLTANQCSEFAVPQPKTAAAPTQPVSDIQTSAAPTQSASAQPEPMPNSKLMIGDLELRSTEAVSGEGTRQSDSKYFHAFQNGACYEFALNVTTVAAEDGVTKHVDRDKVFDRLERILATVKINPVATPEVTAEAPAQTPAVTPAQ
jgi:hypothetical protein